MPTLRSHLDPVPLSCLRAGLGLLVAALMLACAPDDFSAGSRDPVAGAPGTGTTPSDGADANASRATAGAGEMARGLWLLAEGGVRTLDDAARIEPALDRAERLGATDLFVQVYRGGRAFYAAVEGIERAPSVDPPVTAQPGEAGTVFAAEPDSLTRLLASAKHRGLRVHAWVTVLSLSTRHDARMLAELGREAILVDRAGRSILDYPDLDLPEPDRRFYRMGTRGIYLDPAVPAVRARLVETFVDLVTRYPDLDGLHLDYIRHPGVLPFSPGSRFGVGLEFGYGEIARARYRAETGNADPIEGAAPGTVRHATAWDEWRRDQVTTLVGEIAGRTRAARPGLVVSAAVIPYVDRAYLSLAQDWRGWLENGSLDLAIPMVYTLDDRLLRYQLESFAGLPLADRIWPGMGVWLFEKNPQRALDQLSILRRLGFAGEVLFSDDALAQSPALLDALVSAPPPTASPPSAAEPASASTAP